MTSTLEQRLAKFGAVLLIEDDVWWIANGNPPELKETETSISFFCGSFRCIGLSEADALAFTLALETQLMEKKAKEREKIIGFLIGQAKRSLGPAASIDLIRERAGIAFDAAVSKAEMP